MPFRFGGVWQSPSVVCDGGGGMVLFGGLRGRRKMGSDIQSHSMARAPWLAVESMSHHLPGK